jgi:hypothetical protein
MDGQQGLRTLSHHGPTQHTYLNGAHDMKRSEATPGSIVRSKRNAQYVVMTGRIRAVHFLQLPARRSVR